MDIYRFVNINVGGRKYELPIYILQKIPYFYNFINDYNDDLVERTKHNPIFIPRSSALFDEVIAFVLDDKHPFPSIYSYELDYYDIKYDKDKLFKTNVHEHITESNTQLNLALNTINTNILKAEDNEKNRYEALCKKINNVQDEFSPACIIS